MDILEARHLGTGKVLRERLNDLARQSLMDCRVVITQGIQSLGDAAMADILQAVQSFDAFTEDNDPDGEHDFGKITYESHDVFSKWDYYDLDFSMHSADPTDTTVTARVLTIMLAEEYWPVRRRMIWNRRLDFGLEGSGSVD